MLDWLKGRRERAPEYAAVRNTPTRGLPSELAALEASETFRSQRDEIECSLRQRPHRPEPESALFVELLAADGAGVVTMTLPDGVAPCLPIFSSPFRAADYVRTQLDHGPPVRYLSSSPIGLIEMLRDLREMSVNRFALDRCPRCEIVMAIESASIETVDDVVSCWSVVKATELARSDLYLNYAQASARAGELGMARDVALESVSHVGFEDPRAHFLIGQIAIALHDRALLREAKAFLRFFQLGSWEGRLDEAIRSGSPDFESIT